MPDIRIVTFHGIGAPKRELDPGEAPFWISNELFIAILDRIADHPERERIRITFDDSNLSDLEIASPHLLQRRLQATFFVLTGRIGSPGSLNAADICELTTCGMLIGSHGVAHRDWTRLTTTDLQHELVTSKFLLREICRQQIDTAAIPFGRYNGKVLRALRAVGYHSVYSSDRGNAKASAFLKPRTSIRRDTTETELDRILSGHLTPLRWLRRSASMTAKTLC